MIIRCWRAVAGSDEVLSAYADHLRTTTFVEMAELPGHLGATLARKVKGNDNELVVMSFWTELASADHFRKGGFDDAVVKPSAQKLLKSFDLKAEYFETLVSTGLIGGYDLPADATASPEPHRPAATAGDRRSKGRRPPPHAFIEHLDQS